MSYSLSQLDAIGDVDPVAEADVYLAYGRDLQAEEILKEAMRSNPERLAIRTKLLEVYAKRRDTKGFELLATQLYALTRGEGEDWAKAQELGAPDRPRQSAVQPGGQPIVRQRGGDRMVEPLGASTMPQSVLPSPSQSSASMAGDAAGSRRERDAAVDLDLDLDGRHRPTASGRRSTLDRRRGRRAGCTPDDDTADFDFRRSRRPPGRCCEPAAHRLRPVGHVARPRRAGRGAEPRRDASRCRRSPIWVRRPARRRRGRRPLARKLELAEEIRQIGDTEGARDLLEEVVAKASGALKTKAQGMLDRLA